MERDCARAARRGLPREPDSQPRPPPPRRLVSARPALRAESRVFRHRRGGEKLVIATGSGSGGPRAERAGGRGGGWAVSPAGGLGGPGRAFVGGWIRRRSSRASPAESTAGLNCNHEELIPVRFATPLSACLKMQLGLGMAAANSSRVNQSLSPHTSDLEIGVLGGNRCFVTGSQLLGKLPNRPRALISL